MKIIKDNSIIIAKIISIDDIKDGLSFFTDSEDFLQVGSWNYPQGKILLAHRHLIKDRKINRTQEAIIVLHGKIEITLYSENDKEIKKEIIEKNEVLLLLNGGHSYRILEDNTKVIEIKNGPYLGAEEDRIRLVV